MAFIPNLSVLFGVLLTVLAGSVGLTTLSGGMPPPTDRFLTGGWTAALSTHFDKENLIRGPATRFWNAIEYGLLDTPNSGAVAGRDGWLFSEEEFATDPDLAKVVELRLAALLARAATVQSSGTRVVVALVPSKAQVEAASLGSRRPPEALAAIYLHAVETLSATLPAPNLEVSLAASDADDPSFWRTDTHWSRAGAARAAETISAALNELEPRKFNAAQACKAVSVATVTQTIRGDLTAFADAGIFAFLRGQPTEKMQQKSEPCSVSSAALFDTTTDGVILVGTSYSADPRWGFEASLASKLGIEITNAALSGKGPFASLDNLIADGSLAALRPSFVIWEVPVRHLWAPCKGKKHDVC